MAIMTLLFPTLMALYLCLFTSSCVTGVTKAELLSNLHKTESIVFVEIGTANKRGWFEIKPTKEVISDTNKVGTLVEKIKGPSNVDGPLIGQLASLLFLGKNGKPIALVDIICHKSEISISSAIWKSGNKYYWTAPLTDKCERIDMRAEEFVRDIFDYMKINMPDRLKYLRDVYHSYNKNLELEEMIFGKDKK
ncbi:MAG: hypothetical protein A2283_19630 [Lentisphaerae bacterium RIFOXYA12_FULL_48_11]|nr:MAG: hypothetical protein A2283_19630 [Lentisphaerae bacterium RIFOXYA12_FULL_48_11]